LIRYMFMALFFSPLALAQDCHNCATLRPSLLPVVPEWPIEYTTIERIKYETNPNATFCKRPTDMIDTIVLHHSETPSTDTPERINALHLERGTPQDPWYMIAYSYTLNTPYAGALVPKQKVTEGRPIDLVGAHAGSNIFVSMDEEQKKMWDQGKITCGKENGEFKIDPTLVSDGKIKANVTTIGLVVIGNYAQFSRTNLNGYARSKPRYPTKSTQDLIARMSCQLQKKYPRIKNLKWHNFYHNTTCPGTIKQYIEKIKTLARKYGCEFN
jgi:N-acetylmuramoyl-L-alanine amidase